MKRLSKNAQQGETEFKNEFLLVAKLQHRNLVKLLGYSIQGAERLLVYEFLPHTSLDKFIFGTNFFTLYVFSDIIQLSFVCMMFSTV